MHKHTALYICISNAVKSLYTYTQSCILYLAHGNSVLSIICFCFTCLHLYYVHLLLLSPVKWKVTKYTWHVMYYWCVSCDTLTNVLCKAFVVYPLPMFCMCFLIMKLFLHYSMRREHGYNCCYMGSASYIGYTTTHYSSSKSFVNVCSSKQSHIVHGRIFLVREVCIV